MNNLMRLSAIWLNDKVTVETENGDELNTIRITPGMHIRLDHNTILDVSENHPANYTIESVWGDLHNLQLEANLIDNSGDIHKLILK